MQWSTAVNTVRLHLSALAAIIGDTWAINDLPPNISHRSLQGPTLSPGPPLAMFLMSGRAGQPQVDSRAP